MTNTYTGETLPSNFNMPRTMCTQLIIPIGFSIDPSSMTPDGKYNIIPTQVRDQLYPAHTISAADIGKVPKIRPCTNQNDRTDL